MDIHRTEEEQIEAIKNFFHKHGTSFIASIVIATALFFGYQGWMRNDQNQTEQASTYYNELRTLSETTGGVQADSKARFDEIFGKLLSDHANSIYAGYASLLKAKLSVEAGELDKAVQALQWVVDATINPELTALANLRMAHVVFAKGENEKALSLLNAESSPFGGAYEELRGDIYVDMGQPEKALDAYKKAKELKTDDVSFNDRILQMKIDSLAIASAASTASPVAVPADNVGTGAATDSDPVDLSPQSN